MKGVAYSPKREGGGKRCALPAQGEELRGGLEAEKEVAGLDARVATANSKRKQDDTE